MHVSPKKSRCSFQDFHGARIFPPPSKQPLRNRLRIAFEFAPFFQVISSWERLQNKQSWKRSKVWNFFNYSFFIECSSMDLLAKLGIFLRIQVRANSQTRGLEWGWKRKARLGENAWLTRACETDATLKRFQLVCSLRWEWFLSSSNQMYWRRHCPYDSCPHTKDIGWNFPRKHVYHSIWPRPKLLKGFFVQK